MKILKKIKNMIRGIHYFSTELKTKMSSQGAALTVTIYQYIPVSVCYIFMYCLFQGHVGREAFGEQDVK